MLNQNFLLYLFIYLLFFLNQKKFFYIFLKNFYFLNFFLFLFGRGGWTLAGSPLGPAMGKRSQCVRCVHTYRYDAYAVCRNTTLFTNKF